MRNAKRLDGGSLGFLMHVIGCFSDLRSCGVQRTFKLNANMNED